MTLAIPPSILELANSQKDRIEFAEGGFSEKIELNFGVPPEMQVMAEWIRRIRFADSTMVEFRGIAGESPLPETFPHLETLCTDEFGNVVACDYQASEGIGTAIIVYLCHDPFAFVIVATNIFDFVLELLSNSGKSFRPIRDRYMSLIEQMMVTHSAGGPRRIRTFSAVGDGHPLFESIAIARVEQPGLKLDVP